MSAAALNLGRSQNSILGNGLNFVIIVIVIDRNIIFVAFVEDNAAMSSIRYFENHVSYFVQNRRKYTLLNSFLFVK